MTLIEKALCVIGTVIIAVMIAWLLFVSSDPVSLNCRRACNHVDGPSYVDCVVMCEQ